VLHGALQSAIASMDDACAVEAAFVEALGALGFDVEVEIQVPPATEQPAQDSNAG